MPTSLPLNRDFLVDIGGWETLKHAQAMVDAGRVLHTSYQPPILTGRVMIDGRETVTRLKIGQSLAQVENLCPCRQAKVDGTICPHVVAAGLAWIRRQQVVAEPNQAKQAAVSSIGSPPSPAQSAATSAFARHVLGRHPPESPVIEVFVLLPLQLPGALGEGHLRVILEARIDLPRTPPGLAGARPWEAVCKALPAAPAVGEEDEAVLSFLEQVGSGSLAGMMAIPKARLPAFLLRLAGHPRVFLGKKAGIVLAADGLRPKLGLRMRLAGELELTLAESPAAARAHPKSVLMDLAGGGRWRWTPPEAANSGEARLEREATWEGPYAALADGPVVIPRDAVAGFLVRELPALSHRFDIVHDDTGQMVFETETPSFHLVLDGSLAGMTLRVEAAYHGRRVVLPPKELDSKPEDSGGWQTDPENPKRFWTRDRMAERLVLERVSKAGFVAGHRSPDQFVITDERKVADFLANAFPRWRQKWTIELGPRFANVFPRLKYVEPEVTLRSEGSGQDWLSLDLAPVVKPVGAESGAAAVGGSAKLSMADIQRWLQTGQHHQRMAGAGDGGGDAILLLPSQVWGQFREALADSDVAQSAAGPARVQARFAPYLANVLEAQGFSLSPRSEWPPGKGSAGMGMLPANLEALLRPYQRDGVAWICGLAQAGFGGLLADEMGLGKTVQILAFLRRLAGVTPPPGPSLVVAPTSLVENWRAEAERFTPDLRVLVLHGSRRREKFSEIDSHDLVITSYALLRRDADAYQGVEFAAMILDEAQHIKNRASQNAQSAKALRARHRFVLTGTPIENSLFDLWSIFDFLMPKYLGSALDFKDRYEIPISKQRDESASERLRLRLQPFFLRRTKADVIRDLPDKIEQIAWCELSAEQAEVYGALLDQSRREVFDASGKAGQAAGRNRIAVLVALLRLRQASCHLGLLPAPGPEAPSWSEPSGKLDLAIELLNEAIDGGHRILVFSQFVQFLQLCRERLDAHGIDYAYLDGATEVARRQTEIARFQGASAEAPPVFLISLKAGGVGLNLTAADTVLHLDPWWNPAAEDQATARAHRIGQRRVVNAYKLIARGTVEEKILALQQKKRELIASHVTNEATFIEQLDWDEIERLFE
jgi:superfamily II DNA or RNA helicase